MSENTSVGFSITAALMEIPPGETDSGELFSFPEVW
jgi:hypothetical protein